MDSIILVFFSLFFPVELRLLVIYIYLTVVTLVLFIYFQVTEWCDFKKRFLYYFWCAVQCNLAPIEYTNYIQKATNLHYKVALKIRL